MTASRRDTPSQEDPAASTPSRADTLFARLERDILTGRQKPGDKLPTEKAFAEQEGVSRTVVREAIARLIAQGLAKPRQGSGLYVSEMAPYPAFQIAPSELVSIDEIMKLLELRLGLEAEMASLAALRRDYSDLSELRGTLEAMSTSTSPEEAVAADVSFHQAIARAAKNDYYLRFLQFLGARLVPPRSLLLKDRPESEQRAYSNRIVTEHRAILDAIIDQDPVRARASSRSHMQTSLERHAALGGQTLDRSGLLVRRA
jgi:GntR family transcriptional repressor for pyruvate dehydrogenase complex